MLPIPSPDFIDIINVSGSQAEEEDQHPDDAGDDQHLVVEAEPGKVEAHLEKKWKILSDLKRYSYYSFFEGEERRKCSGNGITVTWGDPTYIEIAGAINQPRI